MVLECGFPSHLAGVEMLPQSRTVFAALSTRSFSQKGVLLTCSYCSGANAGLFPVGFSPAMTVALMSVS